MLVGLARLPATVSKTLQPESRQTGTFVCISSRYWTVFVPSCMHENSSAFCSTCCWNARAMSLCRPADAYGDIILTEGMTTADIL